MTSPNRLSAQAQIDGIRLEPEHLAARTRGAVHCAGEDHMEYGLSRTLREGCRVLVAVVSDSYRGGWEIAELRCLHCPLSIDIHDSCPDFSVYNKENVVVAEVTVSPDSDSAEPPKHTEYVISDPHIICSSRSLPTA